MEALLIVDVQNDFCPGGALPAPEGDKVIPVINSIMDKFLFIVASKDWHPEDTIHFHKWPKHCIQNTKGAELHFDLKIHKIDQVFLKGTSNQDDGYSAFEATNRNLEKSLKEREIEKLYIAGLTTEYCVKNSAIDAVKKGFDTYVIEDAIKPVKQEDAEQAVIEMKLAGVKFIHSKDLALVKQ